MRSTLWARWATGILFLQVIAACSGGTTAAAPTASQPTPPVVSPAPPVVTPAPVAPSITSQPQNATVTAGQEATFTVSATGTAPLLYQWRKGAVAIAGATTGSYTTPATSVADSGTAFSVAVSNSAGSITSGNAVLTVNPATTSTGAAPFGHVVIVVEENANYASVVGATSTMPYLNSLISSYGLATQYYSNTHPSIGNYMMLTTGQVLTNNDNETPTSFPVSVNNVVRELAANGKTWKAYAEDLPSVGYLGGDTGNYVPRHVPLAYLTDVQGSAAGKQTLVPFTQFAVDLASGQLPNYSFVTPDLCDDAHNCGLDVADAWLKTNIAPLLASSPFKDDGLLIITFDESGDDDTHGGGRVAAVIVSPKFSKPGYQSTTLYQHESTLRLMLEGLGISTLLPGAAATAPTMWEFFTFPPPP